MYAHIYQEMAKATAQAREEEVRRMPPRGSKRSGAKSALRSRVARKLNHLASRLDPPSVRLAVWRRHSGCCEQARQ
jgi:hypothetical protein